jgi:hypothetical protein
MRCKDADAVATYLRRRHIRGVVCSPRRCPLANWLTKSTGLDCVSVQTDSVWLWGPDWRSTRTQVHVGSVPLPRVLRAFEVAFDRGDYPQLLTDHGSDG